MSVIEPTLERELNGGIQKLYQFENGYGASVVRHWASYGYKQGQWELAVLRDVDLDGDEPYFDFEQDQKLSEEDNGMGIIGNLSNRKVQRILKEIMELPNSNS